MLLPVHPIPQKKLKKKSPAAIILPIKAKIPVTKIAAKTVAEIPDVRQIVVENLVPLLVKHSLSKFSEKITTPLITKVKTPIHLTYSPIIPRVFIPSGNRQK